MRIPEPSLWPALVLSSALHAGLVAVPSGPLARDSGTFAHPPRLTVSLPQQEGARRSERPPAETVRAPRSAAPHPASGDAGPTSTLAESYLPASRLDERPEVIDDIPIDPPSLRSHPEGGRAVLVLWVGEAGTVDKIDEEYSNLAPAIAAEIRTNFYRARFRPGVIGGMATKSRMRVEVNVEALPGQPGRTKAMRDGSGQLPGEGKSD